VIRYLLRRLLQAVLVVFLLSIVIFGIARLSGDPVDLLLPMGATKAQRLLLIHQLGLDQPLPVQYLKFLVNALHGNFGQSIRFQAPAMQLVLARIPNTAELAVAALVLAVVVGVPLGILAAVKQGKAVDSVVSIFAAFGQAVPSFWLGILLILYFGVQLGWLPIAGQSGFKSLIMPAISLSVVPLVSILRLTRSSVIQILHLDYVRTAEAKGLRRFTVLARHVLPNSMMPVITFTGILTGQLLGGAVITEQIFAWPGIGQLAIQSIEARDYAVVQAVTLLTSVIVVSLNLLVDFSYFLLDPRIRHAISSR
jgi:peptide/nickel transport system permease protein